MHQFNTAEEMTKFNEALAADPTNAKLARHLAARKLIHVGKIKEAWMLLLA